MGTPGTKTVMFGAVIHLDPSDIAQADGQLITAVHNKLGKPDCHITIAEVVTQPTTTSFQISSEDVQ